MKTLAILLIISSLLFACSDFGYYSQSVGGHLSLMAKRQPIEEIITDLGQDRNLQEDLQSVLDIKVFAEETLALPVNDNFSTYVDTGRTYAVWNIVAAPAYSLAAKEWCYPVTGCLPYRGYYDKADAEKFAETLRLQGLDVYTYGVPAYSTLGWFEDPVLNTFLHYPQSALAGLIFHELAHQVVFTESDGDFNEAFASTVELEGVLRWVSAHQDESVKNTYLASRSREDDFNRLVESVRKKLLHCYDGRNELAVKARQSCKSDAFLEMTTNYQQLKGAWAGYSGYDKWFEGGLNNARFVSVRTYRHLIPAFRELFRRNHHDFKLFYLAAQELAALSYGERQVEIRALLEASSAENPLLLKAVPLTVK